MYWNTLWKNTKKTHGLDKLQHEMYWNKNFNKVKADWTEINYNMRCIETKILKSINCYSLSINYNMRCIETSQILTDIGLFQDKLQHEMYWNGKGLFSCIFCVADKLQHEMYWNDAMYAVNKFIGGINYNMRCIETYKL